jgi:hypothetical protein
MEAAVAVAVAALGERPVGAAGTQSRSCAAALDARRCGSGCQPNSPANPRPQRDPAAASVLPGGQGGQVGCVASDGFILFYFCFKIGFKTHVKVFVLFCLFF